MAKISLHEIAGHELYVVDEIIWPPGFKQVPILGARIGEEVQTPTEPKPENETREEVNRDTVRPT